MSHTIQRHARNAHLLGLLTGVGLFPECVAAQTSGPLQAGTTLFVLDLAGTPVGEIPTSIRQLKGFLEVVIKDGVPMLRASASSEFLITLPQVLPPDFTLVFDLVPKACCNPQDLSFEGTPTINQGGGSAHVHWDSDGHLAIVGGGPDNYEAPMPEDLRATLPGVLTQVVAVLSGPTIKLYTNGRRHYTLDRQFARGRVLRVFLGGQDDGAHAVHLAGMRIVAGAGTTGIAGAAGPAVSSTAGGLGGIANPPPQVTSVGSNRPTSPATIAQPAPPPPPITRSAPVPRPGATTSLAPPSNLVVSGTPAMASLSWTAPSGWTPTGYTVLRKTVGTSGSTILSTSPIITTQFDDRTGFTAGQTYEYVVTALSGNPAAFGMAQAQFSPPAPQNVSNLIAQQTGTSVTLSWAPLAAVTTYVVNGSSPALSGLVPGGQNRITFANVPPGSHTWTVGARYQPGPIETPTSTWPTVTLSLLNPNVVLVEGNLYKEASRPEVYQLLDGNKIHIPTPDALRVMGYTFADVTTVVDGALLNRKLFQFASGSATPGSLVFPIKFPYAPILLPGSTRVKSQGLDTYVTELRGWLWWTERLDGCVSTEGDLKYGLEVDTDWALSQGIDLHRILWVGNLGPGGGGIGDPGGRPRAATIRPLISMELNSYSWPYSKGDNSQRPADWTHLRDCGSGAFYYPFDPDLPALNAKALPEISASPAQRGPYVRVVGTLLSDSPHTATLGDWGTWWAYNFSSAFATIQDEWNAAALDWAPGVSPLGDPNHPARWTEIHPPDLIEPATPPANPATMKAIGLAARPTECQAAILTVKPDIPPPTPTARVAWQEIVGPETYWPHGKNAQNGSWITDLGNGILVNASVCGGGVGNSPGRFKAFYRVWWK